MAALLGDVWDRVNKLPKYMRSVSAGMPTPYIDRVQKPYIRMLKEAHRFRFDNSSIDTILDLANEQAEDLVPRLPFAKLPFETVWLEWDHLHKVTSQFERGVSAAEPDDTTPRRMGVLLKRHPTEEDCYYTYWFSDAHEHSDIKNADVFSPFGYQIDLHNQGRFDDLTDPARVWKGYFPQGQPVPPHLDEHYMQVVAALRANSWGYFTSQYSDKVPVAISALMGVASPFIEPVHQAVFQRLAERGKDFDFAAFLRQWRTASYEGRGDCRFLITLLSVLNVVPRQDVVDATMRRPGVISHKGNLPFLGQSVVSLQIPAKNKPAWVKKHMSAIVRRHRLHKVRGHWRVSPKQHNDEWKPYIDPRNGKPCFARFIPEHDRGDATLGFILQEYEVRGNDA